VRLVPTPTSAVMTEYMTQRLDTIVGRVDSGGLHFVSDGHHRLSLG
jgi:hypothetical protein